MPCDSSHMNANDLERYLSQTIMLLNELNTGIPVNSHNSGWQGYLPGVYCKATREKADIATAELCGRLANVDVSKYSPEMQIWWREHQAADKAKEEKEKESARIREITKRITSITTLEERRALGLMF